MSSKVPDYGLQDAISTFLFVQKEAKNFPDEALRLFIDSGIKALYVLSSRHPETDIVETLRSVLERDWAVPPEPKEK